MGKESTALLNYLGWDAAHMLYLQTSKADYPNLSEDKHDITHFCSLVLSPWLKLLLSI
ncbi:hypothetical protein SDC49_03955 [Lactobacillus sp. R2/2]|nr:hypothetical protein [Lactobacillus sp. R2/2]